MALTKYKILKRLANQRLVELGSHETNGPKQAMREEIKSGTRLEAGETLVAVPENNWTEQGASIKVTETVELFDTPAFQGLLDASQKPGFDNGPLDDAA